MAKDPMDTGSSRVRGIFPLRKLAWNGTDSLMFR
jgi:hypothetical protein